MWPSGSSVTSGEFWKPTLAPSVVTSAPDRPSKMSIAVGGRDDHVLVAATGEVGGHGRADHLRRWSSPTTRRCPVGAVQHVDGPAVAGLGALDDVELPVALHVGQGRRVGGDAVERVAPGEPAAGVDGEDLVRVRGAGVARCRRRWRCRRRRRRGTGRPPARSGRCSGSCCTGRPGRPPGCPVPALPALERMRMWPPLRVGLAVGRCPQLESPPLMISLFPSA